MRYTSLQLFQGEVTVLGKSSPNPQRDFTNVGSMKKADSTDCMSFRPKQQMVPVTQQPTLLKCIFKGANPDKIKMVSDVASLSS